MCAFTVFRYTSNRRGCIGHGVLDCGGMDSNYEWKFYDPELVSFASLVEEYIGLTTESILD